MKQHVENLINYQIINKTIEKRDYNYVKNQIYNLLDLEGSNEVIKPEEIKYVSDSLNPILDQLEKDGVLDGSIVSRDLFDAKIMNVFAKLPSVLQKEYEEIRKESKTKAQTYLYNYVTNLNYIRKDRVDKNIYFKEKSKYGFIEITINLSKPEKDPKSIALMAKNQSSDYPTCVLCSENEGFSGNFNRNSRDQHRLIEFELLNDKWFFQYSPYIYYNEHAICLTKEHRSMKIEDKTFERLLGLTNIFEGYFFGSNADLPIVGGSILSHEHYQGGRHDFAIEHAKTLYETTKDNVTFKLLNWPLSTIRLTSNKIDNILPYASKILSSWINYNNEEINIISHTNDTRHNTITPIARFKDGKYELDLILRNNRTDDKSPLGIFHPKEEHWHVKKENIGLIEAMGLAILPKRLKDELSDLRNYLLNKSYNKDNVEKHLKWANSFKDEINENNVDSIINLKLSQKFEEILEDCGVFKLNEKGINEFKLYLKEVLKDD